MQITTKAEEQALKALNPMETKRFHTDAAFRLITEVEAAARREKTQRLRSARLQLSVATQ